MESRTNGRRSADVDIEGPSRQQRPEMDRGSKRKEDVYHHAVFCTNPRLT